jgi:hypothetical protein
VTGVQTCALPIFLKKNMFDIKTNKYFVDFDEFTF